MGKPSLNVERNGRTTLNNIRVSSSKVFQTKDFRSLWRLDVECDVDCCLATDIFSNKREMN